MHRADDFSLMWWAHGLRDRSPDGRRLRCVRTGRYGLAMDVEAADIVRLGPIPSRQTYDQALIESNDVVLDLPPAKLDLRVDVEGTVYRCTGSSVKAKGHSAARLISAGRFVQRCDLLGLEFADDRGNRLAAEGRLELIAWPDRLALRLDVQSEPTVGDPWSKATVAVRLTHDDGRVAQSASPAGDLWHAGQKRTCHVVLKFPPPSVDTQTPERTTVSALDPVGNRPCKVEYDAFRGCHRVDLDQVVPQGDHNDALERVRLTIRNPGEQEAVVRLALEKSRHGFRVRGIQPITGLSPMLRDTRGNPLGIPVQISKNWHTQRDPDVPYRGVWFHGYTLLHLPAGSQTELEFTMAYAHWGGVPAASHAQLCLIGWGNHQLWHEAALGAWGESLCFEPDQGQVGGTVLDTRPLMVWGMKQSEPRKWGWTNNVGGADFLVYYDADGAKQWNSRMRTAYQRYGPNL
ncbi:MAG: hypothetical protein HQ581_26340, partial [Planctomycetes bacterium]|nr:hypothetical protein [Planctomycetota bacterium]